MSLFSTSALGASNSNAVSASTINVNGLVSGLKTDSIIEGLLAVEQQRIANLNAQKAKVQTVQSAFQDIRKRLLALQATLVDISKSQNGAFDGRSAVSSDANILTAAASASTAIGTYSFRVDALAQAHQIASQGFDSASAAIPQGTMRISVGTKQTATVTIGPDNATVRGLVDAINAAGIDVSAALVNDGSAAQGVRILLTSKTTGGAGAIGVVDQLAPGSPGTVKPIFDANAFGSPIAGSSNLSTSTPTVGGTYSGAANVVYSFKVETGGTVGTDGIVVSYRDSTGLRSGVLTLNAGDADVPLAVADGMQLQFAAGTLAAGDTFQIKGFVPTLQAAQDAQVTFGSGAGAMTIASSSNVVENVIPGLTLQLRNADPAKAVSVAISNDAAAVQAKIEAFVNAYNDVVGFIDAQIKYDAATSKAGPLVGNSVAISIQSQVRSIVSSTVPGVNPLLNSLPSLGIKTDAAGALTIDSARLSKVLQGNAAGVSIVDVKRLFALAGIGSSSQVQFVVASSKTKAVGVPYQVHATQGATSGSIASSTPLPATTVIDGTNDKLALTLDGRSALLTLAHGTYGRAQLAAMLQATIASAADLQGRTATATIRGDVLAIASNSLGSNASVGLSGGSAAPTLGFEGNESGRGQDVAGWFVVDGQIEPATGSGQFLVGAGTNANTADLQVRIAATADQIGSGFDAYITPSRGFASQMDVLLTSLFDPANGRLKIVDDRYAQTATELDAEAVRQTSLMKQRQASLQAQFVAMEQTLATLKSTSSYLTSLANAIYRPKE